MRDENGVNCRRWSRLGKIMNCIRSGEKDKVKMIHSSESPATKDYAEYLFQNDCTERKPDNGNIEEAESSLRDRGSLNYEEARALLGRYEYQKGNIEAALQVFEGINIGTVTPKLKLTLSRRGGYQQRPSQNDATAPMSMPAVTLLSEAVFLKAKSLQALGKYKDAAQSCQVILDIVESSLPEGVPENLDSDRKLLEILIKAVELLPELWKLADHPSETILSYRRALLHQWNLGEEIKAKIQKNFAVYLLYSGVEAIPHNLRSQRDNSFVPSNNIEEAILLLMIILRNSSLKRIEWDPSILNHLSYALSISGQLRSLATQVEDIFPGLIDEREMYLILALCYYGENQHTDALNLLKKLLSNRVDANCIPGLLMASKICGENSCPTEEGVNLAQRAIHCSQKTCNRSIGVATALLGVSLSAYSKTMVADSEKVDMQSKALQSLEKAGRLTEMGDPDILYYLCLENAEQRKLEAALVYAKYLLKLEGGSSLRGWTLLARVLSAQKHFVDAEAVIDGALDHTGKWEQGSLLRTKAKLQLAQGRLKQAIDTYSRLLAIFQLQSKSFGVSKKHMKVGSMNDDKNLEMETWHDLGRIYINLSRWEDAQLCVSKCEAISQYSASTWNLKGLIHQGKGDKKQALRDFSNALAMEPTHIPCLVSMAVILMKEEGGGQGGVVARSLLTEAVKLDRMNGSAWYNLGILYRDEEGLGSALEAAECLEAACTLEETAPIEPFR